MKQSEKGKSLFNWTSHSSHETSNKGSQVHTAKMLKGKWAKTRKSHPSHH